ncbi:hypothetical protein PV327_000935 [Microctonus hyperodae]|uniref:DUF4789 domain-containing protein n=1 Tax=Microctonus hyperodae TaxID=165561 RepID=A0AA39G7P8_MICHY|nr:hypothetical protein PV327_000935 [Microctonus hyperodae]
MLKFLNIIIMMTIMCNCQDIVFPNDEETSHLSGNNAIITERIPVYIPQKCPENMLLYPGGGIKSAWVCDCRPRFLYFPLNNTCHEAYRQGPCNDGEYVILPVGEVIPKCVINPCREDGLVRYNGICYNLRMKGGPCGPDGVLGVNGNTFQVQCIPIRIAPFIIIDAPSTTTPCPAGSRRNSLGICKVPI